MANIFDDDVRSKLEVRVRSLRPDGRRRWGRMSPHGAICHLSDAFRLALGEKPAAPQRGRFKSLTRFVALHLPFDWPHGIVTVPEAEQGCGGTTPIEFEHDRAELLALIARFSAARPDELQPAHPMLGAMSTREWGRWGYRHLDHHLRQFGA